jgi:ribulose-phosphate 3-epimerase
MDEVLPKFAEARPQCPPTTEYGIDGGINFETARRAVRAGCDFIIAGTFLFGSDEMAGRIARLKRITRAPHGCS